MPKNAADTSTPELIDRIYAALLGEAPWEEFLAKLNGILPGSASTLFFHDGKTGAGASALATGFDPDALRDYSLYYSSINPWMKRLADTPIGIGIIGERLIDRRSFLRHQYYDFISGFGFEGGIGATLFHDDGCSFLISTLTSSSDPDRNEYAARQLTALAPHLRRAFHHYRSDRLGAATIGFGNSLFDALDIGVIVVGGDLKIRAASRCAHDWLASGEVVRTTPLGTLRMNDGATQEILRAMLARGYAGPRTRGCHLPGSKLTFVRVEADAVSEYFAGTAAIVMLEAIPSRRPEADLTALAAIYGLSPAEARVFIGIADGLTISEIADRAGLARETIRTQLKSVYAKTGLASQAALVRLATSARF